MRYTENEKAALAYALYQVEMAKGNAGNDAFKEKFAKRLPNEFNKDVRFDDQYETPIAKIKNEKVGRGKNRQGVKAELRKLSDPDAAIRSMELLKGSALVQVCLLQPMECQIARFVSVIQSRRYYRCTRSFPTRRAGSRSGKPMR